MWVSVSYVYVWFPNMSIGSSYALLYVVVSFHELRRYVYLSVAFARGCANGITLSFTLGASTSSANGEEKTAKQVANGRASIGWRKRINHWKSASLTAASDIH